MTTGQDVADHSLEGTRALDTAKGILVALRGCTLAEAFAEILSVAGEYRVGPIAISKALVELTQELSMAAPTGARNAAYQAWHALLERVQRPLKPADGR